ncbi:MAG: cytochrome c biogenesis protein [Candidatus Zhuqueibacterota bacterium]
MENKSTLQYLLPIVSLLFILAAFVALVYYAPTEQTMGLVQKIFYFHVATAWIGFFAFGVVFVLSILFLWKKDSAYDDWAYSAGEIGVIFTSLVLVTGPLWAKPIWNTYWTWDPRLTTTLILWLIYIGYLMLRSMINSPEKAARISAVYGIIGFVDVPIVFLSISLWRTQHPSRLTEVDPRMTHVLMLSLLAFSLLFFSLLLVRANIEKLRKEIDVLKRTM